MDDIPRDKFGIVKGDTIKQEFRNSNFDKWAAGEGTPLYKSDHVSYWVWKAFEAGEAVAPEKIKSLTKEIEILKILLSDCKPFINGYMPNQNGLTRRINKLLIHQKKP